MRVKSSEKRQKISSRAIKQNSELVSSLGYTTSFGQLINCFLPPNYKSSRNVRFFFFFLSFFLFCLILLGMFLFCLCLLILLFPSFCFPFYHPNRFTEVLNKTVIIVSMFIILDEWKILSNIFILETSLNHFIVCQKYKNKK
jgi:hypothetical protein